MLENGNFIQTKPNVADGSITFDAIEYSVEGEHTYIVREKAGTDTNIDYDTMNAEVKVKVTKDAKTGLLSAAVTMPEDTEFNNYVVSPVVTKFDFTKKLAGRELKAGEFSFLLKDANGAVIETVKNDAAGNVTFSELSFDNTKVGTHTHMVEEVIPANKEFGMTYDTMKATVTVTVAKNGHSLTTVTNVTSKGGVDADGNGDRYIYRNGVKYELIRQEGKSTDKMTEGQTVVTYIYRKVEDSSTLSNGNGGQSGSSTSKAVKATSNGSKGSKGSGSAADGASDGKGSDKKKSGNKDGKKADGSDKAKEGDEQLPVTGDSGNNLEAMGVVVMGLMSGFAAMSRRKNQD